MDIETIVLAIGALGMAAFGIVEALKWTRLGEAGFAAIVKGLGPLMNTLKSAYGPAFEALLRAQYRGDNKELARVIRQGVRVGLTPDNAGEAADFLQVASAEDLKAVAAALKEGSALSDAQRNMLGRFELAVDARIDAALTLAQSHYAGTQRCAASLIAVAIALVAGIWMRGTQANFTGPITFRTFSPVLLQSLLVGIAAVPVAPIAKDLVSALQAATTAIRKK
jgi:hypothetical protein